jgi:cyanocobalamin reductase (cyanide-eliminating) / alkylcobalamin dealkylase
VHEPPLEWQRVQSALAGACVPAGLDIVHAFGIEREPAASSALARIAVAGFGSQRGLGVLIGNTRALWPVFQRELGRDPALRDDPDPLDRYVVRVVDAARAKLGIASVVRFSHVAEPEPLPIQRIAAEVGLAQLSPSHLSIHPEHGPWIALRAAVLFDVTGPGPLPPPHDFCTSCTKPCLGALHAAIATSSGGEAAIEIEQNWRTWLAVRDACPEGRRSRYGDDQIRYHYSKEKRWLGRS